jgi:hypothetical protein
VFISPVSAKDAVQNKQVSLLTRIAAATENLAESDLAAVYGE